MFVLFVYTVDVSMCVLQQMTEAFCEMVAAATLLGLEVLSSVPQSST